MFNYGKVDVLEIIYKFEIVIYNNKQYIITIKLTY